MRNKVAQLQWIFEKHAPAGSSWNYIGVDDGCLDGSGKVMQRVVEQEGYKNVQAVFLQDAVDQKIKPFDKMESTEDSKKGGAVLYGLIKGAETRVPANLKHEVAYCDADLSADLGMLGLLGQPHPRAWRYDVCGATLWLPWVLLGRRQGSAP